MRATLRRKTDGLAFAVIATHLSSGSENEAARLVELTGKSRGNGPSLREWFEASEKPTLLCLDANSAPSHECTVWKELRGTANSVWDEFFDAEGCALKEAPPVTTNKMRGPLSSQPQKIGEHVFGAIDGVFYSSGVSLLQHVWGPLRYASAEEAAKDLLPSLDVPSDHAPLIVDLTMSLDTGKKVKVSSASAASSAQPTVKETSMPTFDDEQQLKLWLDQSGVNTAKWDKSAVGELLKEQRDREAELYMSASGPLRVMRVVNVRIVSDDKRRTLVQTHTEPNGERKKVMQPLSGKLKGGEAEEVAAQRCAEKELGISGITLDPSTRTQHVGAKSTSSHFPHLACRFIVVTLDASVPQGALPQQEFSRDDARKGGTRHWSWQWRLALPKSAESKLVPFNFEALWAEKRASHLQGTREWMFAEVFAWLHGNEEKLFWLKGGGGVGKSVMSAELLDRLFHEGRIASWHFCRHDNKEQS
ncbi:MAG: hypothetical protein ACO32I_08430, partial [Candidatus Limnocylindrus sp.]